jgi:hypothetical protein
VALLDAKIAEATTAIPKAQTTSEKRKAEERREDLMRLKRVEQIYVSVCTNTRCFILKVFLSIECRPTGIDKLGSCFVEIAFGNCNG